MKTSTKLLAIFFLCIPLSLFAYDYLLKREYDANRFTREYYMVESKVYVQLKTPAFKHVVIDGLLHADNHATTYEWKPRLMIAANGLAVQGINKVDTVPGGNTISVLKQYAAMVHTIVKNDTLYLSFHKAVPPNYEPSKDMDAVQGIITAAIYGNNISSVKASNAYVSIQGKPSPADSLTLATYINGQYDITALNINKLTISASGDANLNIEKSNQIQHLYYTLADSSTLRLDAHPVKNYHAVKVSDNARIEIKDKASSLQKNLY